MKRPKTIKRGTCGKIHLDDVMCVDVIKPREERKVDKEDVAE